MVCYTLFMSKARHEDGRTNPLSNTALRNVFERLLQMVCDDRRQKNAGFPGLFSFVDEDSVYDRILSGAPEMMPPSWLNIFHP